MRAASNDCVPTGSNPVPRLQRSQLVEGHGNSWRKDVLHHIFDSSGVAKDNADPPQKGLDYSHSAGSQTLAKPRPLFNAASSRLKETQAGFS